MNRLSLRLCLVSVLLSSSALASPIVDETPLRIETFFAANERLGTAVAATGDVIIGVAATDAGASCALSALARTSGVLVRSDGARAQFAISNSDAPWSSCFNLATASSLVLDDSRVVVGRPSVNYVEVASVGGSFSGLVPGGGTPASYGSAVALDGDTVLVGAPSASVSGGRAFVFDLVASSETELVSPAPAGGDTYGDAVSGSLAAVGAPGANVFAGEVSIFENAAGWSADGQLADPDATAGDRFGSSVALDGALLAVGAPSANSKGAVHTYLSDPNSGFSAPFSRLQPAGLPAAAEFGAAVALSGSVLVVGAPGERAVYVYTQVASGWGAPQRLTPGTASATRFGASVSISDSYVVVGAPLADPSGLADAGDVFVFERVAPGTRVGKRAARCLNLAGNAFARVSGREHVAIGRCARNAARNFAAAEPCVAAPDLRVSRIGTKAVAKSATCTTQDPGFLPLDVNAGVNASVAGSIEVARALFGANLDASLLTKAADRFGARCQAQVLRGAARCQKAAAAAFARCVKLGLRTGAVQDADDLAACLVSDPSGRVARSCDATTGVLATRVLPRSCVARVVDLNAAFPGCGSSSAAGVAACVEQSVRCQTCRAQSATYALDESRCDAVDDGIDGNLTCP